MPYFRNVQDMLKGKDDSDTNTDIDAFDKSWNQFVVDQIDSLYSKYSNTSVSTVLKTWHKMLTIDPKHSNYFSPHVNGFYMIFMVHGTWYKQYLNYLSGENKAGLSAKPEQSSNLQSLGVQDQAKSYFNMLATDIEIPDITEEYTSVSSRLRNSFIPSRNYFVSDFNISYVENINLDIIRYHDAWTKYLELLKRGDIPDELYSNDDCKKGNNGMFLDMPFSNAVWVAVFKPFTFEIQMLIKLMGVLPVTLPLKQIIGNRSQTKLTVLNITYKAADIFYKFYNNFDEFNNDDGILAKSFKNEIIMNSNIHQQ